MKNFIRKLLQIYNYYLPTKWQLKIIFLMLGAVMVVSVVFYTRLLVNELIIREQKTINLYADLCRHLDVNKLEDMIFLVEKVTPAISFPLIQTDGSDEPAFPYTKNTLNINIDTSKSIPEQREYLKGLIKEMAKVYPPIVIDIQTPDGNFKTKFYYTNSVMIDKLKMFPFIEILIVSIFIFLGYIAFSNIRKTEESKVWVGMAKEAAHQLGTPLSSMLAWMEILKYSKDDPKAVMDTVSEMEKDIDRLNMIATRFSKIGSLPEKKPEDLSALIDGVCVYFEKRLPHLGKHIEIRRNMKEPLMVNINAELFAWVFENLLKNAAEAIETKQGQVTISMACSIKNTVLITVQDNGKGMTSKQKRQVFFPGYTTKQRGWGLGLSLSKRIVEEYHNGRIYVKESSPGRGTTFYIEIPIS